MKILTTLPALALLAACGSNTETSTTNTTTGTRTDISTETANGAMDNVAVATPMLTGQQFVDMAASTDAYEIEAGKIAAQKGSTQAIKEFGTMMVRNHTESTAKLKAAAGSASPAITPHPKLTPEMEANLTALRDTTGADFDTTYRTQQVAAHQKALGTLEGYAGTGDVPQLKDWAAQTAPVVRSHLDQISGL